MNYLLRLTPVHKGVCVVEYLLLVASVLLAVEEVNGVTLPATREVDAESWVTL